ncbi:MAG: Hsp20/alpha crystallin family protein [Candidatus Methanomethylicota archaeon]|uniref:Hsp20/alpha crystallin family protein n=2 Tax=Thermoproteota archaeon TaxID=2056631 RepID=A0A497EQR4_9CREN|nr:MAG: Hsp20/alpha crystallin family protein [Candidatus Verstraetearchaeota archaeon]
MVRKRRFPFWFDDIFEEFEREFEYMEEMMHKLMREAFEAHGRERPLVYGFSMTIGPDGKPVIREFGNVRPSMRGPVVREEMEPLVDVMESGDYIKVYAELPGVEKEDIKLNATENTLTISVDTEKRKYYKEISLPSPVKPETAKATYRNGVLEVQLEKAKKPGTSIKIE